MNVRNEEARGLNRMNRSQGAACSLSGRPGAMKDKRVKSRAQNKVDLRREFR